MNQNFAVIILGGTGQVGGAAVAELLAIPQCREVVMVTRKPIAARARVRNVVLDTGAAEFAERTAALARGIFNQGPVSAVSCVGVGTRIPPAIVQLFFKLGKQRFKRIYGTSENAVEPQVRIGALLPFLRSTDLELNLRSIAPSERHE
jgi:hypothetical protein